MLLSYFQKTFSSQLWVESTSAICAAGMGRSIITLDSCCAHRVLPEPGGLPCFKKSAASCTAACHPACPFVHPFFLSNVKITSVRPTRSEEAARGSFKPRRAPKEYLSWVADIFPKAAKIYLQGHFHQDLLARPKGRRGFTWQRENAGDKTKITVCLRSTS